MFKKVVEFFKPDELIFFMILFILFIIAEVFL